MRGCANNTLTSICCFAATSKTCMMHLSVTLLATKPRECFAVLIALINEKREALSAMNCRSVSISFRAMEIICKVSQNPHVAITAITPKIINHCHHLPIVWIWRTFICFRV